HVAKRAHTLTHGLQGLRLPLHRTPCITATQGILGLFHRAPGLVELTPCLLALRRAATGQKTALPAQVLAQRTLTVGKRLVFLIALLALLVLTLHPLTELVLHLAHRLVGQLLLVSQRLGQPVRGPLTTTRAALGLGHAHVLHHAVELFEQLLRLGHTAFVHQALYLMHFRLDLVVGDGLIVLG